VKIHFLHDRRFCLCTYSVYHALVDFVCSFTVIGTVSRCTGSAFAAAGAVLLYDFCAFVLQPFVGLLDDRFHHSNRFAAAGCILVGLGTFFTGLPILAVIMMGIGNACFHIGGGAAVIAAATRKATAAGIFVAPGAIGLSAGAVLSPGTPFSPAACLALMAVCAAGLFVSYTGMEKESYKFFKIPTGVLYGAVAAFLLTSVFTRSYVGFAVSMPWKTTAVLSLSAAAAAAFGKALGGILGDGFGYIPVAVTGLTVSAVLLPFFNMYSVPALAGLVFFNLSMPLVLAAITDIFPGHTGFAFGLNSSMLFPGVFFAAVPGSSLLLAAVTAVCAFILVICFRILYNGKMRGGTYRV
jgi:MFS transporter, FSR family, fosmidomycin resistance protein